MPKPKKPVRSKEQLEADAKYLAKVNREKALVKLMFPLLHDQKSIYDAQTVLQALSGFIKMELDKKTSGVKVGDLKIDLSKEGESALKSAMLSLIGLLELENAKDSASLLERFGNILAQHSAREFMKGKMDIIKIEQIIA